VFHDAPQIGLQTTTLNTSFAGKIVMPTAWHAWMESSAESGEESPAKRASTRGSTGSRAYFWPRQDSMSMCITSAMACTVGMIYSDGTIPGYHSDSRVQNKGGVGNYHTFQYYMRGNYHQLLIYLP
jgi:hypothetical protein